MDLSTTSIGKRRRRHDEITTASSSTEIEKITALTNKVLAHQTKDSDFFDHTPSRVLPTFQPEEVITGKILGCGEFGVVYEVTKFHLIGEGISDCNNKLATASSSSGAGEERAPEVDPQQKQNSKNNNKNAILFELGSMSNNNKEEIKHHDGQFTQIEFDDVSDIDIDEEEYVDQLKESGPDVQRSFIASNCQRQNTSRYAIKRIRKDVTKMDAAIDLVCEGKFLSTLCHPNIIKMRASVGIPGHPGYALLLDRLLLTLEQKMHEEWEITNKRYRGLLGLLHRKDNDWLELLVERLIALYDIARAFRFLHKNRILYRDLKPDNVAFDFRDDIKVFDFGLARELKPSNLTEPPHGYDLTGLCGSRRYMSPEVATCKAYGLSADVYSFGILAWHVFALQVPFADFNINKHFDLVVRKGKRPKRLSFLSPMIQNLIEVCWAQDPKKRPSFNRICEQLRTEITILQGSTRSISDRSEVLMKQSVLSRFGG